MDEDDMEAEEMDAEEMDTEVRNRYRARVSSDSSEEDVSALY